MNKKTQILNIKLLYDNITEQLNVNAVWSLCLLISSNFLLMLKDLTLHPKQTRLKKHHQKTQATVIKQVNLNTVILTLIYTC